jgi:anti-sigma factor RsiW
MTEDRSNIESALAALADGSLPAENRAQTLALVRDSTELSNALATQQQAVELIRAVQVSAPASLHRQINSQVSAPRRTVRPPARVAALGALGAAAATVIAILLTNLGGTTAAPTFRQISALTLSHATMAAALESTVHPSQLDISVQGVAFPYWSEHFGWRATGTRIDRLAGRAVTTVFYESPGGKRIGYAILAGTAPRTEGGYVAWRRGVPYRLLSEGGVTTVTWQRSGHLCVMSAHSISHATLLKLASWGDPQAVRS